MSHSVELSGEAVSSQNSLLFLKLDTGQAQFPFFPVAFLLGFYDSGFIAEGGDGTLLHGSLADSSMNFGQRSLGFSSVPTSYWRCWAPEEPQPQDLKEPPVWGGQVRHLHSQLPWVRFEPGALSEEPGGLRGGGDTELGLEEGEC